MRRRELRSQRGAVLVEAALVLPVMILIVIGILEFGLLYSSFSTTSAASRSGARLAATQYSRADLNTSGSGGEQDLALGQIVAATSADLKVLNNAVPVGMAVYRVATGNSTGNPAGGFPGTDMVGGCSSNCIVYKWDGTGMVKQSGQWLNPQRCLIGSVESVGVYVQAEHSYITGMFGSKHKVEGHTVMRLEPVSTDKC